MVINTDSLIKALTTEKNDTVKALTFDTKHDGWDTSKGFVMREVPMPVLDEKANPEDALSVILKIRYAGVCGSDRGLWYRTAFKDLVHDSLKREGKEMRINGHEFVGEFRLVDVAALDAHVPGD